LQERTRVVNRSHLLRLFSPYQCKSMGEPEAKRARTAAVAEPAELKCPITLELFRDPVSNCVGNTYERAAIEAHLAKPGAKRDPLTNEELESIKLVPNQIVRRMVQAFLDAHPDYTPEGWENRMVPPLPGALKSDLAEVKTAFVANSVPRLLAALSSLPNAVLVQAAGFGALWRLMRKGDEELKKQARESAVYGLVLGAPSAALLSLCSRPRVSRHAQLPLKRGAAIRGLLAACLAVQQGPLLSERPG
jgi:hypothetical protein